MLKEYQIKQLEKISLPSEQTQALETMQPSMTTLLDYQIKRLEGSVSNQMNIERHPEIVASWKITLDLLKEARKQFA